MLNKQVQMHKANAKMSQLKKNILIHSRKYIIYINTFQDHKPNKTLQQNKQLAYIGKKTLLLKLINEVIQRAQMTTICWFHLFRCEDCDAFLYFNSYNGKSFNFGLLVAQKKKSEGVTLGSD